MTSTAINTGFFGIQLPRNGVWGLQFPSCGSVWGWGVHLQAWECPLVQKTWNQPCCPGSAITFLDTVPVGRNKAKGWFGVEFIFLKIFYNK